MVILKQLPWAAKAKQGLVVSTPFPRTLTSEQGCGEIDKIDTNQVLCSVMQSGTERQEFGTLACTWSFTVMNFMLDNRESAAVRECLDVTPD